MRIPNYFKVNKKVADTLGLGLPQRTRMPDGSFLLWKSDLDRLFPGNPGWVLDWQEYMERIGGVGLTNTMAAKEQRGQASYPLPMATDPRFVMPAETEQPDADNGSDDDSASTEASTEAETEADAEPGTTDEEAEGGEA